MLLKYHFSLLGNFGVFFLGILKTNMFSHHLSKRNVILNFLYISLEWLDRILLKSHDIILMMYIIMSETFTKIDSM